MEFKRRIARFLGTEAASEVYTLAVQLFPITQTLGSTTLELNIESSTDKGGQVRVTQ